MLKTIVATCRATIGGWFWLIAWNKANELPKVPMYFTLSREWKLKWNHATAWFPFSSPHKLLELVAPQGIHSATQSMRPAMSSSDKLDLFEASSSTIYSQKASGTTRRGARTAGASTGSPAGAAAASIATAGAGSIKGQIGKDVSKIVWFAQMLRSSENTFRQDHANIVRSLKIFVSVQSCKSPRHWRYGCCKTRKNMTNMQKQKNMKGIQNICIIKNPVHPNHAIQTFGIQKMLKVQSIDHAIWLESKIILASTIQDKCWWNHAKKVTAYPSNGHIIFIYNQKLEMLVKIHIQTSRKKIVFSLKTCKTFGDSRNQYHVCFFKKCTSFTFMQCFYFFHSRCFRS